jgi:ubiquinone/menaquinone biosynthesis C-methylase UbiE
MADQNPQAAYMADESMVRTLAAQAQAIWPQEEPLFRRYAVPDAGRILDAGCGTGEIALRLAERHPGASVLGVDVLDVLLAVARDRAVHLAPRLAFENRSVFDLGLPAASFDLTVCRHVLHAIPEPERALAELVRVTRPGGWLHVIAEDYGMVHFPLRRLDAQRFWFEAPRRFAEATGTDLHVGRRIHGLMRALGLEAIALDYVVVDTLRVPRETFAAIWAAWRDGYAGAIGEHTSITREEALAHFDDQIATLRDPDSYAAWMVPVASARVPASARRTPPGRAGATEERTC